MSAPLNDFPIAEVKPTSLVAIIGRKISGKSTLVRHLLQVLDPQLNGGVIFSPFDTEAYTSKFGNKYTLFNEYSDEVLYDLETRAKELPQQSRVIVCDDSHPRQRSTVFNNFATNGRHLKTGIICAMQTMGMSPLALPANRAATDFVFITSRITDYTERRRLYDYYCGFIPFARFSELLDSLPEYMSLVIDITHSKIYKYCIPVAQYPTNI